MASSLVAELWAIRDGLILTRDLGCDDMIVGEKKICFWFDYECRTPNGAFRRLPYATHHREVNGVADCLAQIWRDRCRNSSSFWSATTPSGHEHFVWWSGYWNLEMYPDLVNGTRMMMLVGSGRIMIVFFFMTKHNIWLLASVTQKNCIYIYRFVAKMIYFNYYIHVIMINVLDNLG